MASCALRVVVIWAEWGKTCRWYSIIPYGASCRVPLSWESRCGCSRYRGIYRGTDTFGRCRCFELWRSFCIQGVTNPVRKNADPFFLCLLFPCSFLFLFMFEVGAVCEFLWGHGLRLAQRTYTRNRIHATILRYVYTMPLRGLTWFVYTVFIQLLLPHHSDDHRHDLRARHRWFNKALCSWREKGTGIIIHKVDLRQGSKDWHEWGYRNLPPFKMSMFQQEQAKALIELLQSAHAVQYTGLDDEMADDCNDWISGLTDDEVADICISVFRAGIWFICTSLLSFSFSSLSNGQLSLPSTDDDGLFNTYASVWQSLARGNVDDHRCISFDRSLVLFHFIKMNQIIPPPIDYQHAFRVMSYDQLVVFLSNHFGYNPKSLKVDEYIAENKKTVEWIKRKLKPLWISFISFTPSQWQTRKRTQV